MMIPMPLNAVTATAAAATRVTTIGRCRACRCGAATAAAAATRGASNPTTKAAASAAVQMRTTHMRRRLPPRTGSPPVVRAATGSRESRLLSRRRPCRSDGVKVPSVCGGRGVGSGGGGVGSAGIVGARWGRMAPDGLGFGCPGGVAGTGGDSFCRASMHTMIPGGMCGGRRRCVVGPGRKWRGTMTMRLTTTPSSSSSPMSTPTTTAGGRALPSASTPTPTPTPPSTSTLTSDPPASAAAVSAGGTKPATTPPPSHPSGAAAAEPLQAFAIGSVAGMLGSLAGMGGGFVMIPLMTSSPALRLNQHVAHGTSLFAVAATGIAGALGYGLHRHDGADNSADDSSDGDHSSEGVGGGVDVECAAAVALCGMVTARIGAATTARLSQAALRRALGVFMLCVAPVVPAKGYISRTYGRGGVDPKNDVEVTGEDVDGAGSANSGDCIAEDGGAGDSSFHPDYDLGRLAIPAFIGLGSGFLAGLFGVGGGAVVVPALTVATDLTHHQALGTSLLAMTLPAIVGCYTHYQRGNVAPLGRIAIPLALGSFMGAYVGGRYVGRNLPEDELRYGFSALMLTLGTKTLLKA